MLCQSCKVQRYCGREYQIVDKDNHKKACKGIKKAQQDLDDEERKLRAFPGDFMTPTNLFENAVGRFGGLLKPGHIVSIAELFIYCPPSAFRSWK